MSTTAPATTRTETDFEPLTIPDEYRASSLVDLVNRTVKRYPAKEALRWKLPRARRQLDGAEPDEPAAAIWRSITYREMWEWVTQVALGLKHLGIGDGDAVCIMSRTRPAWLAADLGAMSLGAITCPIYPSSEPGQVAYVINNVHAKAIFVENPQLLAKIEKVRAECPTLEQIILIEERGSCPRAPSASTTSSTWPMRSPARSVNGRHAGANSVAIGSRPSSIPRARPRTRKGSSSPTATSFTTSRPGSRRSTSTRTTSSSRSCRCRT